MLEHFQHLETKQSPASTLSGFLEAWTFSSHVLDMDMLKGNGGPTLNLPKQCLRRVELRELARKERRQARVLTVAEVTMLEEIMLDEKESLVDRIAAGCFLFCPRGRSRWSDVRKVYQIAQDVRGEAGRLSGYIECKTRARKTARSVAKRGLAIAPIWGAGKIPWGLHFPRIFQNRGRSLEDRRLKGCERTTIHTLRGAPLSWYGMFGH